LNESSKETEIGVTKAIGGLGLSGSVGLVLKPDIVARLVAIAVRRSVMDAIKYNFSFCDMGQQVVQHQDQDLLLRELLQDHQSQQLQVGSQGVCRFLMIE
jgi:hypothetical protein